MKRHILIIEDSDLSNEIAIKSRIIKTSVDGSKHSLEIIEYNNPISNVFDNFNLLTINEWVEELTNNIEEWTTNENLINIINSEN